ncbi:zinc metalloproteinase-disintegrin-like BmMP [Mytilus edulis]|uniref:zinc metalloproteinase-disintegrin-like BmMP n=1 Tax=Mytilus edulis TaxID=6550 RepID=UPI0039F0F4A8
MDIFHCSIFLIVLILELLSSYTDGNYGKPFIHSSEKFNNNRQRVYEFVQPVLYQNGQRRETTRDQNKHIEKATVIFNAFKKRFVIDIHLNRFLFTKSYIEKTFNERNEPVIRKPTNQVLKHCYYHGTVRGVPHSIVSLSSCNGIRGHITDNEQSYYIEPAAEGRYHKFYIEPDTRPSVFHSEDFKSKHSIYLNNATINSLHRKEFLQRSKRSIRAPADSNRNSKYVEMYIVNDNSVYRQHRGDKQKIFQRSQEIANYVSKLYQPLNIFIALVGVEIWTVSNKIVVSNLANTTLDNFLSYRRQSINPHHPNDNAQLITGILFQDSIVGKAIKMSICTFQYSAGVAMDATSTTQVATTVAHELGHNFGMEHDNYSVCLCPDQKCIMATTGGGSKTPTKWSSCSQTVLNDNFEIGLDYCLKNIPEQLFDAPYCGNGFVEDGEECDCGLPQTCDNKCCNASSCKLLSHARCATGRCCDLNNCQPKSAATLCRLSPGECDLPEFCDGETEYCPSDVHIMNGMPCSGGQSYCYNGSCTTPTGQCKLLWGSTGRVSDPICFKMLNINGSKYGNCGYNWITRRYERCDKEDVDCGLLHCVHLNEKLMFWSEQISHATPATFLTKGDKKYVCRSAIMDVGLDMPDPGQVPDGSKCGDHKICLKKKCVPLSLVSTPTCPNCHGNGVCNTMGQCHCNEGFAPPYCDEPGHGGSIHSGPVKIQKVNSLMIGLLVFFLVICPLVIIAVAVINRKKLYYCWNKQVTVLLYRVPKFNRKPKGPKKNLSDGTSCEPVETTTRFRNGGGVDISGPLLTEKTQDRPVQKKKPFIEFTAMKPSSKPKPPPRVKSEALLSDSEPDVHRKLPSAPDLLKHDPIVKKDSFNKEISKPVLISTTDRRSKAFVRESSNEKLKDANKNNLSPPVPPHAALKPSHSDPPLRPPPRPTSMPPPSDNDKKEKKSLRKSIVDAAQKSPQRPPPPRSNFNTTSFNLGNEQFDPNKRKKEKDKPETSGPPAITKFKPEKKNSTNAAKTFIELKKTDNAAEAKKPLKVPSELKDKLSRPVLKPRDKPSSSKTGDKPSSSKAGDKKNSSSSGHKLISSRDQSKSEEGTDKPSVAAMKAMFDQNDSPKMSGQGAGNRPRTGPKPGSKVRSVNV